MHVQNGLSGSRTRIEHDPVSGLRDALGLGDRTGLPDEGGRQLGIGGGQFRGGAMVLPRHHQYVRRRLRVDVTEGDGLRGLADDDGGDVARDNLAEQAIRLTGHLGAFLRVIMSRGCGCARGPPGRDAIVVVAAGDGTGEDGAASFQRGTTTTPDEEAQVADDEYHSRATTPPGPRHRGGAGILGRPLLLAVVAAVLAGGILGAAVGLFGGSDGANTSATSPAGPTGLPSETPSEEPPSATATVTVANPTGSQTSGTTVLPVYYVGRDAQPGDRHYLFREFRRVFTEGSSDPAAAAVQTMLALPPLDSDYTSPWPAGASVVEVRRSGEVASVVLSDEVARHRTDADTAALAAQQLVYTVTAADRTVHQVSLVLGGATATSLFGHDIGAGPLRRAPEVDVVSPVWIIDPYEGATVGRTFTVHGTANVFEATVSYVVKRGGTSVRQGATQASVGSGLRGTWSVELELPAGEYVVEAFESSAENGEPLFIDSKTITVSQ